MALDLTNMISEMRNSKSWEEFAQRAAPYFQNLQDAVNQTASAAGVDATKHLESPDPPAKLNVKVAGETFHATIEDNSARSRAHNYFLEYSNQPSFSQSWVKHLGVSRDHVQTLPTKDDNGVTHNWYFRTYSMESGSKKASSHVYLGEQGAPTAVQMQGSTNLTLLPSTGAGTAPSNGQKPGQGFGTSQLSKEAVKA